LRAVCYANSKFAQLILRLRPSPAGAILRCANKGNGMMKKDLSIGLIEPYATRDGTLWGARMKDLYSMVRLPSRAIDLLAAVLSKQGFPSVTTFNPLYNRYRGRFHPEELKALADGLGLSYANNLSTKNLINLIRQNS